MVDLLKMQSTALFKATRLQLSYYKLASLWSNIRLKYAGRVGVSAQTMDLKQGVGTIMLNVHLGGGTTTNSRLTHDPKVT